jgi:hypothetical protein
MNLVALHVPTQRGHVKTPGTVWVSPVVVKILGRQMWFANANAEYFYSSHKPFLRKDTFKNLR